MTMTIESVIDKVQKLLRLAESDNVHEAAAAAARAQALMDKYNLESSDVVATGTATAPDEPIADQFEIDEERSAGGHWRAVLSDAVARHNHCSTYWRVSRDTMTGRKRKVLRVIGRQGDAQATRYIYSFLVSEIERLCKRDSFYKGRTWAQSYRMGAVAECRQMLHEQRRGVLDEARAAAAGDERALMRVDGLARRGDAVWSWIRENMRLRAGRASHAQYDDEGARAGRAAARKEIVVGEARGGLPAPPLRLEG